MQRPRYARHARSIRRGFAAITVFALVAVSLAGPVAARAQPAASLCVVVRSPSEGLGFEDVRSALELEWRKARLSVDHDVIAAPAPEACPPGHDGPGAVLLLDATSVELLGPGGATLRQDLGPVLPIDRAQELARRVISLFATEIRRGHPVLVDTVRVVSARPAVPTVRERMAGYLTVGGRYGYQPTGGRNRFATDLEGGVSLADERLLAGIRVGFEPEQVATRRPFGVRSLAVPVTVEVRGGGRLHPRVLIRGAIGAGLEWRQLSASVPLASEPRRFTRFVPLLEAELETVVAATGIVRISVAGVIRGFLDGEGLAWQGQKVYDPPRVSVGLALRLGAMIRDGRKP